VDGLNIVQLVEGVLIGLQKAGQYYCYIGLQVAYLPPTSWPTDNLPPQIELATSLVESLKQRYDTPG
jgi:hypothetical protein